MGVAAIVVGTLAVIGLGVGMLSAQHSAAEKRLAAWKAVAVRRGARFDEGHRAKYAVQPYAHGVIEARVAQATVKLDLHSDALGSSKSVYTRARARFVLGAGPRFRATAAGVLADVGRSLGFQDVPLGDEAFDHMFVVTGEDPSGIKAAFSLRTQATLARSLPVATVSSDGHEVTLHTLGARTLGLDEMLDVVGALASVGADGLDALAAALPDATLTPAAGTWEAPTPPLLTIPTTHGNARATVYWWRGGPRVSLTLPLPRELPAFRVVIKDGQAEGVPTGLLSDYGLRLLIELPGVLVESRAQQLELRWLGIPEPTAFTSGVNLLADIASSVHRTGAFR